MNDAEVDQAVRLATEPEYTFKGPGLSLACCASCGAFVGDIVQHDAFHTLLRGLVMGAGV